MAPPDEHVPARFLTLADVAEVLNITARQAYALVRSGDLAAIQVGAQGAWRVEQSALDAYIAARYDEARRSLRWRQAGSDDVVDMFERTRPR